MRVFAFAVIVCVLGNSARAANKVFFVEPANGAEVASPFRLKFGLEGMKMGAPGDTKPGFGHHHLIINGSPLAKGAVIPFDDKHLHFGKDQADVMINLAPGEYTLTLQFGDGAHHSYGPEMSSTIRVRVKPGTGAPPPATKGSPF